MDASAAQEGGPEALGPVIRMTRSGVGVIQSVDASCYDLLGWRPEQMVGFSSTKFHPSRRPAVGHRGLGEDDRLIRRRRRLARALQIGLGHVGVGRDGEPLRRARTIRS